MTDAAQKDFRGAPLTEITAYIEHHYHARLRQELPKLQALLDRLADEPTPDLSEVRAVFRDLSEELYSHMLKEENILFPWIGSLVTGLGKMGVQGPVAVMIHEHDTALQALERMQELTGGYQTPTDCSPTLQALYSGLGGFDAELRQHIDLENLNLFPRALQLCS